MAELDTQRIGGEACPYGEDGLFLEKGFRCLVSAISCDGFEAA
jgi:hypothetical protein